jgi:transcriptional regulator with XRE-family HTH domain
MSTVVSDDEAKLNIATNVKRRMGELGISQAELARVTGENEMRISSVVRAVHLPTAGFLARLAEALRCSIDDLTFGPRKKSRHSA